MTDFTAWRCKNDDSKFCPDEGCPKHFGCVREKGWKPGEPNPAYADALLTERSKTGERS